MNNRRFEILIDYVRRRYPHFKAGIEEAVAVAPARFGKIADKYLGWVEEVRGVDGSGFRRQLRQCSSGFARSHSDFRRGCPGPMAPSFVAGTDRSLDRRVEDELVFWKQVWNQVAERSRLLQVGYDWVHPGGMGHFLGAAGDGHVNLVRLINLQLRQHLPEGAFFVDLEQVSGGMGREAFYDPRNYFWSKHPLSERGTVRLAEHIWVRWPRLVGQLGGLFKVYSDCHSYRQNLLGQIFLSLLLRL